MSRQGRWEYLKAIYPRYHQASRPEKQRILGQMDRRLAAYRRLGRTGRYGATKPGAPLKHHIPLRTDRWDVTVPGFTQIDLVAHSGEGADGEFAHSLDLTDIHTPGVETRAILGRGQHAVQGALEEMRQMLPFRLQGIDSDNGSEFINAHLIGYCQAHGIQFTRGRPYQKDDTAHVEQKNWTHVRRLLGYVRYASPGAVAGMNALYRHELRLFQNLFLPSVKLVRTVRVGARIRRLSDPPQTPFDRVRACPEADPAKIAQLEALRAQLDPFALAEAIEQPLARLFTLAHHRPARLAGPPQAVRPPATVSHRPRGTHTPAPPRVSGSRIPAPPLSAAQGNMSNGATIRMKITSSNGLTGSA